MICPHCNQDTDKYETSRVSIEKDKEGRIHTWAEITQDQDKKQTRKRVDTYTYHATGEVAVINQKVFDAADMLIDEREVKHSLDGKASVVTVIKQEIEKSKQCPATL